MRKKSKKPEKIVEPVEDELAEPLPWEDEDEEIEAPDLAEAFGWALGANADGYHTIRYDPAEDVLRQIAAGQTPEGQRLTRDQMMGMAAKLADGA